MRVMLLAKSSPGHEEMTPSADDEAAAAGYQAMATFHRDLMDAGVLLASERLEPSARGVRVRFEGSKRNVIDGPFVESKELIGGYWVWQVDSMDHAIEWLKRAPFGDGMEIEIREIAEMPSMV